MCGRTTRGRKNQLGLINLIDRLDIEDGEKRNGWNEDGVRELIPLSGSTEPCTQRRGMGCRLVMAVLDFMGDGRR